MWEQMGQMLGMGMGLAAQGQDLWVAAGSGLSPYSSGNYIPLSATTTISNTLCIDNADMEEAKIEPEEPPDEFTQLSNHKFHELLDRFYELT